MPLPHRLKPTLKPADYGKWETLGQAALSPDGKWLAHEIRRTDKNDELRVSPAGGGKTRRLAFCSSAAFSADSRWLACEATVSEAEQDKLKKAKKPVQNKMTVLELATGTVATVDDVQSLAFSGDAAFLAFRRYPPTRDAGGRRTRAAMRSRATRRGPRSPSATSPPASDTTFGNVTGYAWQDNGTNLAITVGVEGRTGNAIQVFDPKAGSLRVLDSGPAVFTALAWRKESSDLAALRSSSRMPTTAKATPCWRGRIWARRAPRGWTRRGASWRRARRSGRKTAPMVYVGIAEWLKKPAGKKSDDDPATVEVWHWKDENVISEQKLTATRDRDRNTAGGLARRERTPGAAHHQREGAGAAGQARRTGARAGRNPLPERRHVRALVHRCVQGQSGDRGARAGGEASDSAGGFQSRRPLCVELSGRPFPGVRPGERRRERHQQGRAG